MIPAYLRPIHRILRALGGTYAQRRKRHILRHLDRAGLGLEIGPGHRPLVPRHEAWNARFLDHLDREGLVAKYHALGEPTDKIETIDYVWKGQPYAELVGETRFDWIVSSHSIEHVPDLVGFLRDCHGILKPGGMLALAVPDHRYGFDTLRGSSTLASMIDAHLRRDTRPTPGTLAEFELLYSRRRGQDYWAAWSLDRLSPAIRANLPEDARDRLRSYLATTEYRDVHVWCLTPETFVGAIRNLVALGLLPGFELVAPARSMLAEFTVTLRKREG